VSIRGERLDAMIKSYLPIALVVLVVLNGLLLVPAISAYTFLIAIVAFLLAILVLVLSFVGRPKAVAVPATVPPPPSVTAPPAAPAVNQAEGEIAAFLALLQEKGRLVDFLMEDVSGYDDAQVGAAARVIHQGCKEVLKEHFRITPVSVAQEGSQVTVPAEYAADEYRLIGKISGTPPFSGKLIHKGWKTDYVKLPRITKSGHLPAIAPAEVELTREK
jgi:Na+-transporting methylmalonyl-CoA/oxaloacetate decarboxylase gamma subunit